REFLQRVESIKQYAVHDIGLRANGNFTTYKQLDRSYLVNVVQASDATSFTPYEWSYPFLGKLPYKGYYDPKDAHAEAERLKKLGYDVIVRRVDAFSTLGFLKDPVYSFMSKYSTFELASLIIHEQTHATVFLKGQDQFNEEFATFVGDTGAMDYLAATFGKGSPEYTAGIDEQADSQLFLQYIGRLTDALRKLYESGAPRSQILAEKAKIIAEYQLIYTKDYLPRLKTPGYRAKGPLPINNAYLSLFSLYTADIPLLQRYYSQVCGASLRDFVVQIKRLSKERGRMVDKLEAALKR
ncbi:MAG TPA: aminopeptidase, partial [Spirochaetia bacterium]|nr:aminopeptidase [Spirochaetia bacterium]